MIKRLLGALVAAILLPNLAHASTCSAYTYTLTNGTTADANAVMSNFNNILGCANSALAPLASPSFTGTVGVTGNFGVTGPVTISGATSITGTTSLFGNVGIGTSSPGVKLTLTGGAFAMDTAQPIYFDGSSDPYWLLGRNLVTSTGGFLTGGALQMEVYGASNQGFEIVNPSDVALVDVAGNGTTYLHGYVGIGTTTPAFPLDIAGGPTGAASTFGCVSPGYGALIQTGAAGSVSCTNSFTVSLRSQNRILAPEVDAISDMRLKNLVNKLSPPDALAAINGLKPLLFRWKPEAQQHDTSLKAGFFAQEVVPYVPVAVSQGPGVYKDQYFLNYQAFIPYLVSAVQELDAKNKALEAELHARPSPTHASYERTEGHDDSSAALKHEISDLMADGGSNMAETRDRKMISVLFAAVTEQQSEIQQLRSTVSALKGQK